MQLTMKNKKSTAQYCCSMSKHVVLEILASLGLNNIDSIHFVKKRDTLCLSLGRLLPKKEPFHSSRN